MDFRPIDDPIADARKRDSILAAAATLIAIYPQLNECPELIYVLGQLGLMHGDELARVEGEAWHAVAELPAVILEAEARAAWRDANLALEAIIGGAGATIH